MPRTDSVVRRALCASLSLVVPGAGQLLRRRVVTALLLFFVVVMCYFFFWVVLADMYDNHDGQAGSWRWIPLQVWYVLGVGVSVHVAAVIDAAITLKEAERGPLVSRRERQRLEGERGEGGSAPRAGGP